jgi:serine phosphatase RsbU (regulator of sigma subunit)
MKHILVTRLVLIIFLLHSSFESFLAQPDSLIKILKTAVNDSEKVVLLNQIIEEINDDDVWFPYNEELHRLSAKNGHSSTGFLKQHYARYLGKALNNYGYYWQRKGNSIKGLNYYYDAMKIFEFLKDKEGMALCYNNMGYSISNYGNLADALEYYQKSLNIWEELRDSNGIAASYNNIGHLHKLNRDTDKSLEYFLKSLSYREKNDNPVGYAISLTNIGYIHQQKKNYFLAKKFYEEALELNRLVKNPIGHANSFQMLGSLEADLGSPDSALIFTQKAIKLRKEIGDPEGVATCHWTLARIYKRKKNYPAALEAAHFAHRYNLEQGYVQSIATSASILYEIYSETGNSAEALRFYKLYISMRDSLSSKENKSAILKNDFQRVYERKLLADSLRLEEQRKLDALKHNAQIEKQKTYTLAGAGGFFLMLVLAGVLYLAFKSKKKSHEIISKQHRILEEKNKEILDSINYSRRLQEAILPSEELMNKTFPSMFLIYQPKDIIAGDFYWCDYIPGEAGDGGAYFAVADCTGHGVPGALVSVVCSRALNQSVQEYGLRKPGEILTRTRELVIATFTKNNQEVMDGMDISLIRWNKSQNILEFSGANRSLWIWENDQIKEIKGDRMPVGLHPETKPFTTHQLNPGLPMELFMFSDGAPDQFGGLNQKKLKLSGLRSWIIESRKSGFENVKQSLEEKLSGWKMNHEQMDDITMAGIKLSPTS